MVGDQKLAESRGIGGIGIIAVGGRVLLLTILTIVIADGCVLVISDIVVVVVVKVTSYEKTMGHMPSRWKELRQKVSPCHLIGIMLTNHIMAQPYEVASYLISTASKTYNVS